MSNRLKVKIANELNRARECGVCDRELEGAIADFMVDSDDEDADDSDESDDCSEPEIVPSIASTSVDVMATTDSEEVNLHDSDGDSEDENLMAATVDEVYEVTKDVNEGGDNAFTKRCHCLCKLNNGERCITQFTDSEANEIRMNMMEMTPYEKDLILLGIVSTSLNATEMTIGKKRKNIKRQKDRLRCFYHEHKKICRDTFIYLMDISLGKLANIKKWYKANGLVPRKKKSGGRQKTALTFEDIKRVYDFLNNYACQNALLLPGRVPGFRSTDVKSCPGHGEVVFLASMILHSTHLKILPTSDTKAGLWKRYCSASAGHRTVKLTSFKNIWSNLTPNIVIGKPMSDLCWTCQLNNTLIVRSTNLTESEKSDKLKQQEQHLTQATSERSHYVKCVSDARGVVASLGITDLHKLPEQDQSDLTFHYSFDFAQQLMYPCDPLQPGPIFFMVPRRCQIFGVMAEGLSRQINYLVDESVSCGKGANVVISLVHHFLDTYAIGERHLSLHADNCAGQNKNNYFLWYILWRVASGRHSSITLSFMLAGHTKFGPDWAFGVLKKKLRHTRVSCLQDIANVVDESSVNTAHLVGNEKGEVSVPTYDWSSFLAQSYKKMVGMKEGHHFTCTAEKPGIIAVKHLIDTPVTEHLLQKSAIPPGMPPVIQPKGLDDARQAYLFKNIRQFCDDEVKDLVCPATESASEPVNENDDHCENDDVENEPPAKVMKSSRGTGRGRGGRGRGGRGKGKGK